MANILDNNEQLAFQEEEENLAKVETVLDELISGENKKADGYLEQAAEAQNVLDNHMFKNMAASARDSAKEYADFKPSPYYGRIDVSRDNGDTETFFIGYNPLLVPNKTEILSWKSPLGMTFNQKSKREFDINGYHYILYLRRAVKIEDEKLQMVTTEYDVDTVSLDGEVIDPFLLSVLRDKRRNHVLTDIVRTIQENQNDIIAKPIGESFVVQGCAGSGKTMILLHRISYLAYNYPKSDFSKWCILTPNEYFNEHIQELSQTLDIAAIKRFTVEEYYGEMMRYLLPLEESKKGKFDVVVQSEKILDCSMLTEIYSTDLRDRVVSTYNEIWEKCLSVLEENNFLSLVGEISTLIPSLRIKIPDLTVYKFSTYGTLLSLLQIIKKQILDSASKYDKAKEDLKKVQVEIDKLQLLLNTVEDELRQSREATLAKIKAEIDTSEAEVSKQEDSVVLLQNDAQNLESKQEELKKKIEDQELSVSAGISDELELAKYEYVAENDTALTALIKETCSVEFAEIASLESELKRIPVYNFGKRNKVKKTLLDAKDRFSAKAIEVVKASKVSTAHDIEIMKQELEGYTPKITSIKGEILEKKQQVKKTQEYIYILHTCNNVINEHEAVSARKLLQESNLSSVRDIYVGYLTAINKLTEVQREYNTQIKTSETLNKGLLEAEGLASRRHMIPKIDTMQNAVESVSYKMIKRELGKLLEQVYKKYGYRRRAGENYRHVLYYKLLMASLYYPRVGTLHTFVNIDEAQDIAVTEYELFKSILGEKCVFNLYGDVNQLIYDYKGVFEWEDLSTLVNDHVYLLNENYRNTIQITKYCNQVFGAEITAIGLEGNAVQEVDLSTAIAQMLEECENSIDSRFGIIYKRGVTGFKDVIESMIAPELISWDCVDPGRISVIPIEMAKGLEFESVIVITNFMSENEKYISFTRALENLYVADAAQAKLVEYSDDGNEETDVFDDLDDYDEIDEAELFKMFTFEMEDETAKNNINYELTFDENAPLVILPETAQKFSFREGMPFVASFFEGNFELARRFMDIGIYLCQTNPAIQIRVSREYVGFANPKEYSMVYVVRSKGSYSAKFKHASMYFDYVQTSIDRLLKECDICVEYFEKNKDSVKLS